MLSNAPLERLLHLMMALDGVPADAEHAVELRCLMRKIEWVANEAEATLQRCRAPAQASRPGLPHAA